MARKHGLSRWQFSLRTLLVVTSLAAMYFAYAVQQDAARRKLVEQIEDVGGSVKYDESRAFALFRSQRVVEIAIPYSRICEVKASRLKSFRSLSALRLMDVDMTRDDVRLQCSEIRLTTITDEAFDQFGLQVPR